MKEKQGHPEARRLAFRAFHSGANRQTPTTHYEYYPLECIGISKAEENCEIKFDFIITLDENEYSEALF